MPTHIQRRATRQRADFAGSLRDGSYFRQGGVAKALWCARHHGAFRSYPWRKSDPAKWSTNSAADPYRIIDTGTDPKESNMERRLVDLELKGYEEELHRRNGTLDILQADRMRYWLAGWKQSYAVAFDHDDYARELNEHQCLERIKGLEAFIADREKNQDPGTAEIYRNWLKAMVACFELATGRQLDEPKVPDADESVPDPKAMQALPWLARRAKIGRLTGQTPRNGDQGKQVYETWYADWHAKTYAA